MKNKYITALSAVLAVAAVSSVASAQSMTFVGNGGVGVAFVPPLSTTLTNNKFDLNYSERVAALFNVLPVLSIGPTADGWYLPYHSSGGNSTSMYDLGAAIRLHRDHTVSSWSPYVELDGGANLQVNNAVNPFVSGLVGVDFSVEPSKTYWVGGYINFTHAFDTWKDSGNQTELTNFHDVSMVSGGVSFSFDYPVKPVVHTITNTITETKTVEVPVVHEVVVAPPAAPVVSDQPVASAEQFSITQLSFTQNSSSLNVDAQKALDEIATVLNQFPDSTITVEGKASMEGGYVHNLVLSHSRATAVVDYLTKAGVAKERLRAVSVGAIGEPNDATQRSVDFLILSLVKINKQ